jgi:hypothetical protein
MRAVPKPVKVTHVKRVKPNPVSGKKRRELEQRRVLRMDLLTERGPHCEAHTRVCKGTWVDMHELLARSQGGDPLDKSNILCVCRACHTWIGNYPREALELGLRHTRQVQCA